MKSTGEVMGIDSDFSRAFDKSQLAAGNRLPNGGTVFISIKDRDKEAASLLGGRLSEMGFSLMATAGTSRLLASEGLAVQRVNKVLKGRPHCIDAIISGEVYYIINTTVGAHSIIQSYGIRYGNRASYIMHYISYYTTITSSSAAVGAIEALRRGGLDVAPRQSYFIETS